MRLVPILMAAALATQASAQTLDPAAEAAALAGAQQATIAGYAATAPNAQTVPGYGGEAPGLQGYTGDGAALASAGQGAVAGNTLFETTSAAASAAGSVAARASS